MSSALASSPRRVHVVPLPESRPPVVPPDEVFARRESEFVQDSLALDFLARDELFAHQLSARAELPDPAPLVAALAQAFVEVMAGLRPPPQVSRWTSPEVYAALCRRAAVATRRGPASRRPAVVRRVRVQEPADGVVEACAVVIQQDRVRALALRLTGLDRRWIVTELSVG
ncbi:MAG: hypothetical protein IPP00_00580 [Actinomycetales bacterium]|jgi:hypothetical protein|uniref:3-hydroxyacyl-CoA dehydrogenase n=1 Tax=Candidatus Phosphoribacter hodrii TaxID=2953743 RepID=A0A934X5A6_9MICO|nr:hypothetical protein [Candidatus Phosphoribacter hodrii]MBL0002545.1 hypothetical protein [Candidatus Phosphoribacter hodrii]HOI02757.1 Rv3235 family protein [Dermatophilaceae bacterium]